MKKIYLFVALALFFCIQAHAQSPKFIVEVGAGYFKNSSNFQNSNKSRSFDQYFKPYLKTGLIANDHFTFGLSYSYANQNSEFNTDELENWYSHINYKVNTHTPGIFARYNFWPISSSKWNAFVEFHPHYSLSKTKGENNTTLQDSKSLNFELLGGASYAFNETFGLQLSIHNLVLQRSQWIKQGDIKSRVQSTDILTNPTENASLSFTIKF